MLYHPSMLTKIISSTRKGTIQTPSSRPVNTRKPHIINLLLTFMLHNYCMIIMDRNKGFTLIELSVVIVIIGLIVAGIVGGQSLVKQSQLKGIIADIDKFKVASNTFKLQYDAWPGDMKNATAYWPTVAGDGDGDRYINQGNEGLYFWQHLVHADLIQGSYTGLVTGLGGGIGGDDYKAGINIPSASVPGMDFLIGSTFYFNGHRRPRYKV